MSDTDVVIKVKATPLSFRVAVTSEMRLAAANSVWLKYYLNDFITWKQNKETQRWEINERYYYFDKTIGILYLPRYDLPRFIEHVNSCGYRVLVEDLPLVEGAISDINLKEGVTPKDKRQQTIIDMITDSNKPLRGIALQPGGGKTFLTIAATSVIKRRTRINVYGLQSQWIESIEKFTDGSPYFLVQGSDSVKQLTESIDKEDGVSPHFIICSIPTLREYAKSGFLYESLPPYDKLDELWNVGIRVIDEAHTNFNANLIMDMRSSAKLTIPLTATFDVTNTKVKRIFDSHYPPSIRAGLEMYRKYINVVAVGYNGGYISPRIYTTREGYNHINYEKWLLKNKSRLNDLIDKKYITLIYNYFLIKRTTPDVKMLILCVTRNMCDHVRGRLVHILRNHNEGPLKINVYVSGSSKSVLNDSDIIISTIKSSGTGRDIARLMTTLNTVSVGSDPLNEQIMGRLREPPSGYDYEPTLVYLYDKGINPHVRHHTSRKALFHRVAKTFREIAL